MTLGAAAAPPHGEGDSGVVVEVEEPQGPGIDFDRLSNGGLIGWRARAAGIWLGFDRAALLDSDDGSGRRVRVLVRLPASTFAGARLRVDLVGGWMTPAGPILVGHVFGGPIPVPLLARAAAGIGDGATWLEPEATRAAARRARQRYRERQSHARISGGRAWDPSGALPPELARFETPHSGPEYRLSRVPPRYLRALKDLLDDDERLLYWVERPIALEMSLRQRLRRDTDRRAAMLALTDRQLLWIVDHAQPDRYLSDWGVDVELVPIERVVATGLSRADEAVILSVRGRGGERSYRLPAEFTAEVAVMRDLIERFTPGRGGDLPRRRYRIEPSGPDVGAAARFGQEADAARLLDAAGAHGEVLAFLFSPRRPGQRHPAAMAVHPTEVEVVADGRRRQTGLDSIGVVSLTLSPLVGRLSFGAGVELTYPAPLAERAAAVVRLARKLLADAP